MNHNLFVEQIVTQKQIVIISIISIIVLALIFIISAIIVINFQKHTKIVEKKQDREIRRIRENKNILFIQTFIDDLFDDLEKDLNDSKDSFTIKISDINQKYKSKIEKIIQTSEFKAIERDHESKIYLQTTFLKTLLNVSASNWHKKFYKELGEIYGK